ncbi:MAG: hypothetical protein IJ331_06075 [Ruminococcus sp.]|nr:hypothetical protein [Ruminococcus sp.]
MIKFNDVDQAKTAIAKALSEDNWQKYVLLNQDGDMKDLYVEKEHVKWFNDVVSFGSFDSEEQGEKLLLECLNSRLDEIAYWLVKGNNMPLKLYFTLDEPIGYCFDQDGSEYPGKKVQLCLRRDRKNVTQFGIFVSHFHPIYEFI